MNISGVLVHAKPGNCNAVGAALEQLEGVEVHGMSDDGRMVVTIEQARDRALSDCFLRMHDIPDLISVAMIYHQFEEDSSEDLRS